MKNIGYVKVTNRGPVRPQPGNGLNSYGQPNLRGKSVPPGTPIPQRPSVPNRRKS